MRAAAFWSELGPAHALDDFARTKPPHPLFVDHHLLQRLHKLVAALRK
jgi:hypothetical protein